MLLTPELHAAYVRTDAVAGPLIRSRLTDDPEKAAVAAYEVARALAAENLRLGIAVVVDGVNATHERRAAWRRLASEIDASLLLLETTLDDAEEHRRRVEERRRRPAGYLGPSWESIATQPYEPWDEDRYGSRVVVEMSDASAGLLLVMRYISSLDTVGGS